MQSFRTLTTAQAPVVAAPDGSRVRVLLGTAAASTALFELDPGQVAAAVVHATVHELWFVHAGRGRLWRFDGDEEQIVDLVPGLSVDIPCGTHFQFRAAADQGLVVLGVTLPPWPGPQEARPVAGPWEHHAP